MSAYDALLPHVCAVRNLLFFPFMSLCLFHVSLLYHCFSSLFYLGNFFSWPKQQLDSQGSPLLFTQIGILLFILTVGKLTIVSSSATHLHENDHKPRSY
jgi:hypothetical protein